MTRTPGEADLRIQRLLSRDDADRMADNLAHWESQASRHGERHDASWADGHAIELETRNLLRYVEPDVDVLDAGCANGFTTFRVLDRAPRSIRAFDLSGRMIEQAKAVQGSRDPGGKITFYRGNVLEIPEADGTFDLAYTIRVLINLPTWDLQREALSEIHRVLKPGGRCVLSEAFSGAMGRLNALRAAAGLPPIAPPAFNVWIDEAALEAAAEPLFAIEEVSRFSSPYYVATRFLRDLTVVADEPPSYDEPLHRLARELPVTSRSGDFGGLKAYVLRKRG